jgi:hypothetical protein
MRAINSTTFHKNEGCRDTGLSVKNARSRSKWIPPSHGGSRWFDPSIAHPFERQFCRFILSRKPFGQRLGSSSKLIVEGKLKKQLHLSPFPKTHFRS